MSGHNKWSKIKRQKEKTYGQKSKIFGKMVKFITVEAKKANGDRNAPGVRAAVEKAKAANMPMANIERSIQRVKDKAAAELHEVTYEGYGPVGTAILVECATDNLNRTLPEVRLAFSKHGGNMAEKGSVAFQFDRKGVIRVKGGGDDMLLQALDAGADDVQEEQGEALLYTDPKALAKVRDNLKTAGIEVIEAELTYVPNNTVEVSDEATAGKIMRLMDALDELDDVSATHTNFDITEDLLGN